MFPRRDAFRPVLPVELDILKADIVGKTQAAGIHAAIAGRVGTRPIEWHDAAHHAEGMIGDTVAEPVWFEEFLALIQAKMVFGDHEFLVPGLEADIAIAERNRHGLASRSCELHSTAMARAIIPEALNALLVGERFQPFAHCEVPLIR